MKNNESYYALYKGDEYVMGGKYKEAIQTLKHCALNSNESISMNIAIENLEELVKRNTPKRVKTYYCPQTNLDPEEFEVTCPFCDNILNQGVEEGWYYCPACGQAIEYDKE